MKDGITIAIITTCLVTACCCGIVGGAFGMVTAAIVIHDIVDFPNGIGK